MNYAELQAAIAKTNEDYAKASSKVTGGMGIAFSTPDYAAMNNAVEERKRAVEQYNNSLRSSASSSPPPAPSAPPPPPPPPVPPLPVFNRMTAPEKNIKPAPSDIIQFDESSVDIALIQDLLYEDIGAVELANISRTDLIDGQDVLYSPIRNLSSIRREFNPNNIIATSYATDYFSRFGIDLIARKVYEPYFDEDGNLVVEIENVGDGEEIQVQILSSGTINIIEEL